MRKIKFFNFRPFLLLAILMIVSIIISVFVADFKVLRLCIFMSFIFMSVVMILFFISNKNKNFLIIATILIIVSIPFLSISIKSKVVDSNLKYESNEVMILGRVSEFCKFTKNDYLQITIDNIEISEGKTIEKIDGKIRIYTNADYLDLSQLNLGTYIFVTMKLDFYSISSKDKWELSNLSKSVIASGFANFYDLKIYENNDAGLSDIVKMKIFHTLNATNMKNSELAIAMLFGDSNLIENDIKNIYQGTGIAHLLAVSGLHVSVVVFLLSFLMKRLNFSKKLQIIFLIILLGLYSSLCNFSISVIRASLMAVIINYSYIRGKPYDRLSVLSLLATIILLIDPMQLFNISFVLSFLAVLSIILLCEPIKRILSKIFYDKFAGTLALAIAIQIGLMTVNMFYFNKIQPLSFIANIISIPVATMAFILLIVSMGFVIALPSLGFLCRWSGELYQVVSQYNNYLIRINPGVYVYSISPIFIPVLFLLCFILSDYCFVNKKIKLGSAGLLTIGYLILLFI